MAAAARGRRRAGGLQPQPLHRVGVQVDISESRKLKGMCFQLVDNRALSTQGQPDVNLHRLTMVPVSSIHTSVVLLAPPFTQGFATNRVSDDWSSCPRVNHSTIVYYSVPVVPVMYTMALYCLLYTSAPCTFSYIKFRPIRGPGLRSSALT